MRREWSTWRAVKALRATHERDGILFYSHGRRDWPHLMPVAHALAVNEGLGVTYVCEAADDPALAGGHPRIRAHLLDGPLVRAAFLATVEAKIVVSSLPDLGTGPWRRSARASRYVFVPHSLASCHMIYRPGAFDAFDEVFCAGPYQRVELEALEKARRSPPKTLVEFGYPRLDALLAQSRASANPGEAALPVLLAPSWGPNGILERYGVETIDALLAGGCRVVVRPHPETPKRSPECIAALRERYAGHPDVALDDAIEASASLADAAVMISDWSGAALEFAFGFERPVVFLDTPRKVNNPAYAALGIEPIEAALRAELGAIVPLSELPSLADVARRLASGDPGDRASRVRRLREQHVFNPGRAAQAGARRLRELAAQR